MTKRIHLAIAVVVLLAVPGLSMAAATGSPELSAHVTDGTVAPGETTTVEVVLLNEGDVDSGAANPQLNTEVTTARGVTANLGNGGGPFDVKTTRQAVGNLGQQASQPISFQVVVPDDAEPGTYQAPVRVRYAYTSYVSETDGSRQQSSEARTFRVPITVEERARFDVVDVRSNVSVGSSGTIALTVENNGSMTARDTRLSLGSTSPDVTVGGAESGTRSAGTLEPGDRRTVYYSLSASESADSTPYAFTLGANYRGDDDQRYTDDGASVDVAPEPEQSFALGDVDSTLRVGDDGRLSGRVTNTADRTVDDVVLAWSGEQRNVNPTETEYAVGDLGAGESAEFDFDVEVSDAARSGPRQFSLVANYADGEGEQLKSDPLSVREQVRPARDEFDVEIVRANVTAGDSATVELHLTNAVNETLSDVSAKLFADAPVSTGDDEAYVPALEPGQSETLKFSVSASGGALEKQYPLSMDFQYDEPDGDTVTSDTYRVPVQVTRNDGGGLPTTIVGGAGLLVLVGLGAFLRFR